jgi:hypothetical protein
MVQRRLQCVVAALIIGQKVKIAASSWLSG